MSEYSSSPQKAAYDLGCEHARNAASWAVDGNTSQEHIRAVLQMLKDGDPAVYDYLPREPNLSGEFADDLTPRSLCRALVDGDPDDNLEDELADEYERGVSDAFLLACETELRAWLDDES